MQFVSRLALPIFSLISFLALASAPAFAGDFAHQGVAADAQRYETFLKANWKTDGKTPADLKAESEKVFAADPRAASRLLANAVAANPKDTAAWSRLAEALLAIKPDENTGERYDLLVNA